MTALNGAQAGTAWVARRFPVRIGRTAPCEVRLEEEGVWDRHLEIQWRRAEGLVAQVQGAALVTVNGHSIEHAALRPGDVLGLGSARLQFALSPTQPRRFRVREVFVWLALTGLCVGQAALIYWLVG